MNFGYVCKFPYITSILAKMKELEIANQSHTVKVHRTVKKVGTTGYAHETKPSEI